MPATSQRKLQALLGFTETDLNANRRGRLSAAQVKALQDHATTELRALLVAPVLLAGGLLLLVDMALALPGLALLAALAAGLVALHREHLKTLKDKKVRKLSGYLSKAPPLHGVVQYIIAIDGEQLPIDRMLYEQLSEGHFVLYLLEDARQILAMEPLVKTKSAAAKTPAKTPASTKTPVKAPASKAPAKAPSTKTAKTAKPAKTTPRPAAKPTKAPAAAKLMAKTTVRAVDKPAKPTGAVAKTHVYTALGRTRRSA